MHAIVFNLLALVLLALALVFGLSQTRPWLALEGKVFDLWTTLAAPGHSSVPVVIVAIDEPSFQQLGQSWPFPRSLHGRLIERLVADGARAIAMDVVFADPAADPAQDAALARAIAQARAAGVPLVLASATEQISNANTTLWTQVLPLGGLLAAGAVAGNAGVQPDEDFVVRRPPQSAESLSAVLARLATGKSQQPVADWIAYRGPRGTFDTRSYYQVLEPGLLPPGFFKDKWVLVGRSALAAGELQRVQVDLFNSPFGALGGERLLPGVELHATLLDNLLTGAGLRSAPSWWSLGLVGLAAAALLLAGRRWSPAALGAQAAAWGLGLLLLSWGLFVYARLWLAPLLPLAAVASVYAASALLAWTAARHKARQTRAMFAQYVPPEVVARLVEQPQLLRLGGEVREVTLMFTDLANFTGLSERLSAEHTVQVLTGYFNAMTPLIHASGGTVDKFIGDAVMAFWGAPLDDAQHAEHAVRSAIAMQQAMAPLQAQLAARGLPPIHMRIGLHSGRVVVGNVGSEQRFSYTAIGDAVNLAARLEGANKAFGTGILLSAATAAQLPPDIGLRALDEVIVKGKTEPVRVFTPCADARLCQLAEQGLNAFVARDWRAAEVALHALLGLLPGDLATMRLLQRVAQARELPPEAPWAAAVALDKL